MDVESVLQWSFGLATFFTNARRWMFPPCSLRPRRTSAWAVFRGFPSALVMCAAGDGGHATLILLPSSGKYPSSLCRTKTTKSRVWLQPAGFSAPTRTCPRVTACCSLLPIYPRMTLPLSLRLSLFWPSFQPMKDTCGCRLQRNIPPIQTRNRGLCKVNREKKENAAKDSVVRVCFMEAKWSLSMLHDAIWLYEYSDMV